MTTDEICWHCDEPIGTTEYEVLEFPHKPTEYWHSLCLKAVYEDDDE
jgi:hypothetical protein